MRHHTAWKPGLSDSLVRKIIIAIDSFKGSLTSGEAALAAEEGIKEVYPNCEVIRFPIADGGEGVLDVLVSALNGVFVLVGAHDPLMQPIDTRYGLSFDGKTALIEMAAVNGLPLVPVDKRNPLFTTTFGTGELIRDALNRGCRDFIIGIGGSATNDAGLGMLQALGYRFLDKNGQEPGMGGQAMEQVVAIDYSSVLPELAASRFTVICDVNNPFYGPNGAAYVFASQKGADGVMIKQLDNGMRSLACIIHQYTGKDMSSVPGAGAAGGLGGALSAFLNAKLVPGIDLLLDMLHFKQEIADADLIITGEGKLDRQTLMGKVPCGILKAAQEKNIPVIAIAGKVEEKAALREAGFQGVYSVTPDGMPLERAMVPESAKNNIRKAISSILKG